MHTPNDDRLIRALRASRDARLTGALRVQAASFGCTLFFDSGHIYFAVVDGEKPSTDLFAREGISREMLQEASKAPRSADRFADALMSVGAPGNAVRSFARRSILAVLTSCARLAEARFAAEDRRHPYGPAFTFDVDDLLEAVGVLPSRKPPAALEPAPVEAATPTHETETGLGFRRRTGLKAAAMAAQAR